MPKYEGYEGKLYINISPSWEHFGTAKEIEEKLGEFTYKGPGWYIDSDGRSILLLPDTPVGYPYWKQCTPEGMRLRAMVYDVDAHCGIYEVSPMKSFNAVLNAPVRVDDRRLH